MFTSRLVATQWQASMQPTTGVMATHDVPALYPHVDVILLAAITSPRVRRFPQTFL